MKAVKQKRQRVVDLGELRRETTTNEENLKKKFRY